MPTKFIRYDLPTSADWILTVSTPAAAGVNGAQLDAQLTRMTPSPHDVDPVIAPGHAGLGTMSWSIGETLSAYRLMVVATVGGNGPPTLPFDVAVSCNGQTMAPTDGQTRIGSIKLMGGNYLFPNLIVIPGGSS